MATGAVGNNFSHIINRPPYRNVCVWVVRMCAIYFFDLYIIWNEFAAEHLFMFYASGFFIFLSTNTKQKQQELFLAVAV